jgi:hypothetical protein
MGVARKSRGIAAMTNENKTEAKAFEASAAHRVLELGAHWPSAPDRKSSLLR